MEGAWKNLTDNNGFPRLFCCTHVRMRTYLLSFIFEKVWSVDHVVCRTDALQVLVLQPPSSFQILKLFPWVCGVKKKTSNMLKTDDLFYIDVSLYARIIFLTWAKNLLLSKYIKISVQNCQLCKIKGYRDKGINHCHPILLALQNRTFCTYHLPPPQFKHVNETGCQISGP